MEKKISKETKEKVMNLAACIVGVSIAGAACYAYYRLGYKTGHLNACKTFTMLSDMGLVNYLNPENGEKIGFDEWVQIANDIIKG